MSNVSANVIQSMFNHLTASYSEAEARDILVQKYPEAETVIKEIKPENYRTTVVEMGKVKSISNTVEASSLKKAVQTKVAKPKVEKAPKAASKVDQARELFNASADQSRAAMIAIFQEKLGMSKAAASTYYYNVKG